MSKVCTHDRSAVLCMFPPGTAALKTWLSLQQKPSPLTGSYPSMTSSRRTRGPSCAPWGSRHLPTPDWPEDGHSPALCVAESSGPQQTTWPEEPVAQFIVFWLTFKLGVCLFACVRVFTRSLVGSAARYLKWPNCSWWWSSFPWPVILSPGQSLGTEGTVNPQLQALKCKRLKLLRFVPEMFFLSFEQELFYLSYGFIFI